MAPIHHFEEFAMKANVGGIDRSLRIAAGLVLIALAATGTVGAWGWLGVVPLATGAIGWCPPYAILGFNTCAMKKD
jgi:O-antigen ligase